MSDRPTIYASDAARSVSGREETRGTFKCPICGYDKPHPHSNEQVAAYREDQIRGDGWISAIARQPNKRGWYLCLGVTIDPEQYGKPEGFGDYNPRWSQLSWFLWVRAGAAEGDRAEHIPEVLFYSPFDGWHLRNCLGNAVRSGEENRKDVRAQPKYWRELPEPPK